MPPRFIARLGEGRQTKRSAGCGGSADEPMGTSLSWPGAIPHRLVSDGDRTIPHAQRGRVCRRPPTAEGAEPAGARLQIGFLKMTGGTLNSVEIIPPGVLEHLGRQLGCAP